MKFLATRWQKALGKSSQHVPSGCAAKLERALPAPRDEDQSLLPEISGIEAELDGIRTRNQEELNVLEQRLGHVESEHEAAHCQLQSFQHSLKETITKLEITDAQVVHLGAKLDKERRKLRLEIEETLARGRLQERHLGWVLAVAGFAFLLGVAASVTGIRDTQNNSRLLAELSRDIKDIRATKEQQLGSARDSLAEYRLSRLDELTDGQAPNPQQALAAKPEGTPDRQQAEAMTLEPTYGFHPYNQHRCRAEMRAFFTENAGELGVVSLDSGLQYKVLSHGNGNSPGPTDRVVMDYQTFLADGTELFSSYGEAEPTTYRVAELIPGLREALQRMDEGAQWELYIPPRLAYKGVRKRGRGKLAFEPLIYVVELRSIMEGGQSIEN
jgi:FKBP-type peptidyl-prolyl cis-trans isomerase